MSKHPPPPSRFPSLPRALAERLFEHVALDPTRLSELQESSRQGALVYVLGSPNVLDFVALETLTGRYELPQIRFVNHTGMSLLRPATRTGWLNRLLPRSKSAELRTALAQNGSAVMFLRRPAGPLDAAGGAVRASELEEDEELIYTLFDLQRARSEPIRLVPLVFVWTRSPEPYSGRPAEMLLEPREWPGLVLAVGHFALNYRYATLKAGEPLDLRTVLADRTASDVELGRKAAFTLLRRLERERRAVTGPGEKAPARVRGEIMRGPRLRAAVEDLAGERTQDRAVLIGQANAMLRELQAMPDVPTRSALELVFHQVFERTYAGYEIDADDVERLRQASRRGSLMLLPSHKSHFDYMCISYIFNALNLPWPLIASGDNLNFFPAGPVLRRGGAFFIRRSFKGDRLYAAVVDSYVRRLIRDGHTIELYLEGGRSRTGKLLTPKFGLLNMLVDATLGVSQETTFFVPISIGYEHVVDARSFQRELTGGEKTKENVAGLLKVPKVLRHRYGRVNLQIGQIMTLPEIRAELGLPQDGPLSPAKRRGLVMRLGNRVMDEINRVTAVTPGSLTALVLLNEHPRARLSYAELYQRARRLLRVLAAMGARITPSTVRGGTDLHPASFREAMQMFVDAELAVPANHAPKPRIGWRSRSVRLEDATIIVPESARLTLDTSKNMVVHFFVERGLVALAVAAANERPMAMSVVHDRVQKLSHLLKYEFRFRTDAGFEQIFQHTLQALLASGCLAEANGQLDVGSGADGWTGTSQLATYANMLKNFLEGYRVAARAAATLSRGPLTEKELVKRALALGPRMLGAGEIERREAISKPIFENALLSFLDEQYLQRDGERLKLADSLRTPKAAGALEGRIAAFCWDT